MAKPRRRSRFLTVLLCLCLLANLVPVQAMAAGAGGSSERSTASGADGTQIKKGSSIDGTDYYVTSVKNYSIAPDISERVIITNNDAGNSQTVANVMEVSTTGGRAKIVAGYGNRNPKEQGSAYPSFQRASAAPSTGASWAQLGMVTVLSADSSGRFRSRNSRISSVRATTAQTRLNSDRLMHRINRAIAPPAVKLPEA